MTTRYIYNPGDSCLVVTLTDAKEAMTLFRESANGTRQLYRARGNRLERYDAGIGQFLACDPMLDVPIKVLDAFHK